MTRKLTFKNIFYYQIVNNFPIDSKYNLKHFPIISTLTQFPIFKQIRKSSKLFRSYTP